MTSALSLSYTAMAYENTGLLKRRYKMWPFFSSLWLWLLVNSTTVVGLMLGCSQQHRASKAWDMRWYMPMIPALGGRSCSLRLAWARLWDPALKQANMAYSKCSFIHCQFSIKEGILTLTSIFLVPGTEFRALYILGKYWVTGLHPQTSFYFLY